MVKRTALRGNSGRDKQWGMSGRRGNLEGDEFGQEEMRRGETGVKKVRGEEEGRGE